jgi:putative glutamine amidotransferase
MNNLKERTIRLAVPWIRPNYAAWLHRLAPAVECTDFTGLDPEALGREASRYDALILTGGGDLQPGLYGCPEAEIHCAGIDPARDVLEWRLTEIAFSAGIPVFGICRGLQLLNVVLGGSLFPDIKAFHGSALKHKGEQDEFHEVELEKGFFAADAAGSSRSTVNSAHHQAIDRLAQDFRAVATSPDGIIEAVEYSGNLGMICQAVQWHPERMDPEHPLSVKTGRLFLEMAMQRNNR